MAIKQFDLKDTLSPENNEITYKVTLRLVTDIQKIVDNLSDDDNEFIYKEFRHSSDGDTFSYWKEITTENLGQLEFDETSYLRIRYSLEKPFLKSYDLTFIAIHFDGEEEITVTPVDTREKSPITVAEPINIIGDMNPIADLEHKLSDVFSKKNGIPSTYYKSDVVETDMFLNEHNQFELDCGKPMEIVFEDNALPDLKVMVTPFGTTIEAPVLGSVDYHVFRKVFGENPGANDVLFIPMTQMIWEVNSVNLIRGVANRPVYWDLTLVKYNPKSNRDESKLNGKDLIEDLRDDGFEIFKAEDVFKPVIQEEQKQIMKQDEIEGVNRITNDKENLILQQMFIDRAVTVNEEQLDNNLIIVSYFNYDFSNVEEPIALTYNKQHSTETDITFSSWFKLRDLTKDYSIKIKVDNQTIYSSKYIPTTDTQLIYDEDGNNFIITVDDKIINEDVPNGIYYLKELNNVNIFNSLNLIDNKIVSLDQYGLLAEIKELKTDSWYNIVYTESARYNEIGVYFYELSNVSEDIKLHDKCFFQLDIDKIEFDKITIGSQLKNVTNIRLFDEKLPEEFHGLVINQEITTDSHKLIISDNVKPENLQTYYGRPL